MTNPRPTLAVPRPSWPQDIVTLNDVELGKIAARVKRPATPDDVAPTGLMARVRWVWSIVEREAPGIIQRAERFFDAPGAEKKAAVVSWLNRLVDVLEATIDIPVVPALMEGMVWRLVRKRIPGIVQRVFDRLDGEGVVNAPSGPGAAA